LVHGDIARAQAWTEMLALRVSDMYNFSILHNSFYGEDEIERLEVFKKHVSERLPHRTFTYDTKELMKWKSKID
jgi:hypothetical protein